jgi:integration host factor subunit beta
VINAISNYLLVLFLTNSQPKNATAFLNAGGVSHAGECAPIRCNSPFVAGNTMTKSELVNSIKRSFPYLSEADCLMCINSLIDFMGDHLSLGNKFEIRGFGTFSTKTRQARTVRNPKTGEQIQRKASAYPCFRPGKMLKDRVNDVA